jgi:threonine/homoserine/homoserine lactone efflux protein
MTDLPLLAAFVGAAALLTITPGVDTALVLRTAVAGGARAAWFAALGIGVGCLAWAGLVSLGVAALMQAAPLAFEVLKWAGAAYLGFLGLSALFRPRSEFSLGETDQHGSAFRRGLLTNTSIPRSACSTFRSCRNSFPPAPTSRRPRSRSPAFTLRSPCSGSAR